MFRKIFLLVGLLTYVNACATDENGDAANAVAQTTITITAVTPTVADWDTQVTLTGTGYGTAGGIVLLNRVPALVETWTDTEVKFRVPTGVEPGFATLTLVAGESFAASTLGIRPTLVNAPVSARAGAQISITGHNLGSAGTLSLLGAERTELNATWSPTAITATIPYGFEPGRYTLEAFNAFAASVTFDVVNSAPSLTSVSLGGAPFYEASTLVALPSGWSDPDNDREGYRFQWHRNGLPIVGATGEFLTGQDFDAGDQLFVRVVPDDGSDQGMAVDSTAVTILNSAPVLAAAYVADAPYGAGSEIRVTPLNGVDADGETVTFSYEWYVNGLVVPGQTAANFTGAVQRGDTIFARVTPTDGVQTGQAIDSNAVTIGNSTPAIAGVYIGPSPFYVTSTLTAAANGWSDLDGDAAQYRYVWYVNGVMVGGVTAATLTAPRFAKGDEVFAVVTPTDGITDGPSRNSNVVRIQNSAPSITSAEIPVGVYTRGSTLSVATASWSDADGDAPDYTFQWQVNGKPIPGATGATLSGEFVRDDLVNVVVTPHDGESAGSPIETAEVTIVNSAPSVASVDLGSGPFYRDSTLSAANGTTADIDGDTITLDYAWYKNGTLLAGESGSTLAGVFQRGDEIYVAMRPYDGIAYGATVTSSVVTIANLQPTLAAASVSAGPHYVTSTLTVTPSGFSDGDGDAPQYAYAWYKNGVVLGGETGNSLSGAFVHGDNVYAVVTPYDGIDYGSAVTSNTVTIQNTIPSVASASIGAGPYYVDSSLSVSATGWSDADNDAEGYQYQWYVNGFPAFGETADTFAGGFTRGDAVYVQLTPDDGTDTGTPVNSNTITIQNTVPSTTGVDLDAGPYYRTSTISAAVDPASDADGDTVVIEYAWYKNGLLLAGETGTTLAGVFAQNDSIYVEATPFDGIVYGATVTSAAVTIQNQAPTLTSASIGSGPYDRNSTITVTPGGFNDADGDSPQYAYAWYVNGSALGVTASTLSGAFAKDDAVYAVVTPYDGNSYGAAVTSNSVTIENLAPSLTSVSLGSGPFDRNSTLSAVASGYADPDGDAPQYAFDWTKNGNVLSGETGNTLSGFVRGDEITVTVTPYDGTDYGTPVVSPLVTIGNAAPVITAMYVDYPAYSPAMTVAVDAYDPDGDPLSFSWGIGGVEVTAPTSATEAVLAAPANNGSWLVSAYVSDSTDVTEDTAPIQSYTLRQFASFRGDAQGTGRSAYSAAATGVLKWKYSVTGSFNTLGSVVDENGDVYVSSYGQQGVYAFEPDGTLKWSRTWIGPNSSSLALTDDLVIGAFGYSPASVHALNRNTGATVWSYALSNQTASSPSLGPDGTVYIGDANGKFFALRATNGTLKWSKTFAGATPLMYSTAAFAPDGTVYAAEDDTLYALDPTDGSTKWTAPVGRTYKSTVAVAPDGTIFVGGLQKVFAFNPDGTPKWTFGTDAFPGVNGTISLGADGTVYAAGDKLYAINPNGSRKWTYAVPTEYWSSTMVTADGTVYVGGTDGLYTVKDGALVWKYTSAKVEGVPAMAADGTIYVNVSDGYVHAIK